MRRRLRSTHDREILRLSTLALGSLAAEPLYLLVDTAIVGHLGRSQLAALGLSAVVLTGLFAVFNFLTYGTTAQVARASGAGQERMARKIGVQAVWLSLGAGCLLAGALALFAEPVMRGMGADGETLGHAVTYTHIAAIGLPFAFLARGAEGWLRGVSELRTPLVIYVAANAANVVLEVLFVYGFGWGIAGSAWGTAIAQAGMGLAFAARVLPAARGALAIEMEAMRRLLSLGKHIFVRTSALYVAFVAAGAVAARFGDASLGAHQIAIQLWGFLALVLDSVAIAGQVIVGRMLGAGDGEGAFAASVRMVVMSVALGAVFAAIMLAVVGVLPRAFTDDGAVRERAEAVWPLFALMQPLNGAVFALDGILIGAGDGRYLMWSMVVSGVTATGVAVAALVLDWGLVGVWAALVVLIAVRLVLMGARFLGRRWLVTGWAHD
ncbi:MAG: MATE family efflux transporter [Gaiellaceae bacterium]